MKPRVPPGCSPVVAYVWRYEGFDDHEVEAFEYWPLSPGIQKIDGRNYIVSNPAHGHLGNPTHERLENGDVRPMPKSRWAGGGVYFNRSRRVVPLAPRV